MSEELQQDIQQENTKTQQEQQVDPIIEKARELGWRPKEEFHGDESQFIDAGEFIRRQPLFDKIDSMGRELKETKKVLTMLQEHHEKVKKSEYDRALKELREEKKRALVDGDADKLLDIDDAIAEIRTAELNQKKQDSQPQVDPRFQQWQDQNRWYGSNTEMREFADSVGMTHAKNNPGKSPEDVLKYVESQVKRAFPEQFTNPKRTQPSAVDGGKNSAGVTSTKEDFPLTDEERKVMNTFVRSGLMTKEEYIAQLKSVRG